MNETVKLFGFEVKIGKDRYAGEIPATSWAEADVKVALFGGKVYGEIVETIGTMLCAKCSGQIVTDKRRVSPMPEEEDVWLDLIGEDEDGIHG